MKIKAAVQMSTFWSRQARKKGKGNHRRTGASGRTHPWDGRKHLSDSFRYEEALSEWTIGGHAGLRMTAFFIPVWKEEKKHEKSTYRSGRDCSASGRMRQHW